MASFARRRIGALIALAVVGGALLAVLALDARSRAEAARRSAGDVALAVHFTGLSELALSTRSSWLRHPVEALGADGTADAPSGLDVDPAGAAIPRRTELPALTMEPVR